jgi:prepilin-type N-terminal cleavage/methylation domain-containing protein
VIKLIKNHNKLTNSFGFSLIEIMVTLAIVSVGIYAITSYFTRVNKSHNTIVKRSNERNIVDIIYRALAKPPVCQAAFRWQQLQDTALNAPMAIAELNLGVTKIPVGSAKTMGPGLVSIDEIRLDTRNKGVDVTDNNQIGGAELRITFNRGKTFLGSSTYVEIIPLTVKVAVTSTIVAADRYIDTCHAGDDPLIGQWTIDALDTDNMYYQKTTYTASGGVSALVPAAVFIGGDATSQRDFSEIDNLVLNVGTLTATSGTLRSATMGNLITETTSSSEVEFISHSSTFSIATDPRSIRIPVVDASPFAIDCDGCPAGSIWIDNRP